MREQDKPFMTKWAFFHGYICTANEDGSIPLNSKVVADMRLADDRDAQRIVAMHNEMMGPIK